MKKRHLLFSWLCLGLLGSTFLATTVPNEVQFPGTQPLEVSNFRTSGVCDNCHADYDAAVEPSYNWEGSMMSKAGIDPLFWATVAIAEQDFDGVGDLCLRCHMPQGWMEGRSTPTDGSALTATDAMEGVSCHICHRVVNPDDSEHVGEQNAPFLAHSGDPTPEGYYGSGMFAFWAGSERIGPYDDANASHQVLASSFHRESEMCGTCHDVSNPVTGDLAHNNGAQVPLAPGSFSGVLGDPVATKAAFKNPPYAYGVVERTFSEHIASAFDTLLVSEYPNLPAELKGGVLERVYLASQAAGQGGDYADGTPRAYTCMSCHMAPVVGKGCDKQSAPLRNDLPAHDLTGGNYWVPEALLYLDDLGELALGTDLSTAQRTSLQAGAQRARANLEEAAALIVQGDTLLVVNRTGHKLISGYPEGRRMWLNVKWYDGQGGLLREDGAYGPITVTLDGQPVQVESMLDLGDPNGRVYEAHMAMTQEWADELVNDYGYSPSLVLAYDRETGAAVYTLGQLSVQSPGTYYETFHFALNNLVSFDNRIPPYGYSYDQAEIRNALPVPADQYGDPGVGGTYTHYDEVMLDPPLGAVSATIDLLYQPTSWEYIQFLYLANTHVAGSFLADFGDDLLDAWLNTGMADPHIMASTVWSGGTPPPPPPPHDTESGDEKKVPVPTMPSRSRSLGPELQDVGS